MHAHQVLRSSNAQQHKAVCAGTSSQRSTRIALRCVRAVQWSVRSLVEGRDHSGRSQEQEADETHSPAVSSLHAQSLTQNSANDGQPPDTAAPVQQPSNEAEHGPEQSKQQGAMPYSFYLKHPKQPIPVQLPPPDASPEPALVKPFFVRSAYKPPTFLQHYPGPSKGAPHNYISFLGAADPNKGKFLVPQQKLEMFLESYFNTMRHLNRRMHLAECYNDHPYKYFQELDFPWDLDINIVLALIPAVVQIVTEETCRVHRHTGPLAEPLISMRTPYKVHLNYPNISTVEAVSGSLVRKAVVNRCRVELSGQPELQLLREEQQLQLQLQEAHQLLQPLCGVVEQLQAKGFVMGLVVQSLMQEYKPADAVQELQQQQKQLHQQAVASVDSSAPPAAVDSSSPSAGAAGIAPGAAEVDWESVVDFPHGSLRMIGSCKAPWMDSDPEWVQEKCYSRVEYVDGFWMRQPLTLASIQQCSMLLTGMEQMLYEQSDDFLEASYQAVKQRQQLTQTKSTLRRATKCLALLQELLTAVQENNTEAVISVQREARKNYMLANADQSQQPEVQQTRKQQQEPAQKPGSKAKRDRAPQQQAAEASAVRQKQREALERLQQLQAAGAGVSTAHVAAGPKLVRPLGSHIFGGPSQPPPQQQQ